MDEQYDTELARAIYLKTLTTMKFTLDMEEQKYPERGRNDDKYRFFKKHLMRETYDNLRKLFENLDSLGLIQPTDYNEDVKDGYKSSPSGGSGYVNTDSLNTWLDPEEVS